MNTKLKHLLFILAVGIAFSSCQKCETCTVVVKDFLWDDGLTQSQLDDLNATYQLLGYNDAQDYYDQLFTGAYGAGEEYCDDDLDVIKDEDDITVPGSYTVGWECVE
tara:strand:- start:56 stop:376 length:321 start_codon:yes stop_codon:yes gene_type:complete